MELVPIIWNTLLLGTIILCIVLLISFFASKLRKNNNEDISINLIPDQNHIIRQQRRTPKITVKSSRLEKQQLANRNQAIIFPIEGATNGRYISNLSEDKGSFNKPNFEEKIKNNPRFTIVNKNLSSKTIYRNTNYSN